MENPSWRATRLPKQRTHSPRDGLTLTPPGGTAGRLPGGAPPAMELSATRGPSTIPWTTSPATLMIARGSPRRLLPGTPSPPGSTPSGKQGDDDSAVRWQPPRAPLPYPAGALPQAETADGS